MSKPLPQTRKEKTTINKRVLSVMDWCVINKKADNEKDFCGRIGFVFNNMNKIKSNETSFNIHHCIAVAKLSGCSLDFLVGHTDQMFPATKKLTAKEHLKEALRLMESK